MQANNAFNTIMNNGDLAEIIIDFLGPHDLASLRESNRALRHLIISDPATRSFSINADVPRPLVNVNEVIRTVIAELQRITSNREMNIRDLQRTYQINQSVFAGLSSAKVRSLMEQFDINAMPYIAIIVPEWRGAALTRISAEKKKYNRRFIALGLLLVLAISLDIYAIVRTTNDSTFNFAAAISVAVCTVLILGALSCCGFNAVSRHTLAESESSARALTQNTGRAFYDNLLSETSLYVAPTPVQDEYKGDPRCNPYQHFGL